VQYCADRSAHFVNDLARSNKLFTDVLEGAGFDPAERIGPAMLRELDEANSAYRAVYTGGSRRRAQHDHAGGKLVPGRIEVL
jgi:hypothetical protein